MNQAAFNNAESAQFNVIKHSMERIGSKKTYE